MRCIAIGGIPGTGKTTLMRKFLDGRDLKLKTFRKLVVGHEFDDLIVLGDYSDNESVFAGTDKFSMAVQSESDTFFKENTKNVVFEGDRIFNSKTLEPLSENYELLILILETEDSEVEKRYKERGSEQSDKFINGRRTKCENVKKNGNLKVHVTQHSKPEDTDRIVSGMNEFLKTGKINFELVESDSLGDFFD